MLKNLDYYKASRVLDYVELKNSLNSEPKENKDGQLSWKELDGFVYKVKSGIYSTPLVQQELKSMGLNYKDLEEFADEFVSNRAKNIDYKKFFNIADIYRDRVHRGTGTTLDTHDLFLYYQGYGPDRHMHPLNPKETFSRTYGIHNSSQLKRPVGATQEKCEKLLSWIDKNIGKPEKRGDGLITRFEFGRFAYLYSSFSSDKLEVIKTHKAQQEISDAFTDQGLSEEIIGELGGNETIRNLIVYLTSYFSSFSNSWDTIPVDVAKNISTWNDGIVSDKENQIPKANQVSVELNLGFCIKMLEFIESKVRSSNNERTANDRMITFVEFEEFINSYNSGLFDTNRFRFDLQEITGSGEESLKAFMNLLCDIKKVGDKTVFEISNDKWKKIATRFDENEIVHLTEFAIDSNFGNSAKVLSNVDFKRYFEEKEPKLNIKTRVGASKAQVEKLIDYIDRNIDKPDGLKSPDGQITTTQIYAFIALFTKDKSQIDYFKKDGLIPPNMENIPPGVIDYIGNEDVVKNIIGFLKIPSSEPGQGNDSSDKHLFKQTVPWTNLRLLSIDEINAYPDNEWIE